MVESSQLQVSWPALVALAWCCVGRIILLILCNNYIKVKLMEHGIWWSRKDASRCRRAGKEGTRQFGCLLAPQEELVAVRVRAALVQVLGLRWRGTLTQPGHTAASVHSAPRQLVKAACVPGPLLSLPTCQLPSLHAFLKKKNKKISQLCATVSCCRGRGEAGLEHGIIRCAVGWLRACSFCAATG